MAVLPFSNVTWYWGGGFVPASAFVLAFSSAFAAGSFCTMFPADLGGSLVGCVISIVLRSVEFPGGVCCNGGDFDVGGCKGVEAPPDCC